MYSVTIKYRFEDEEKVTYSSSRFPSEKEAQRVADKVLEEGIEDDEDGLVEPTDIISVAVSFSVR